MSRAGSRGRSGWAPLARQPRVPGRTLHEPAARWTPNEPDPGNEAMVLAAGGGAASASKRTRKPLEIGG